MCWFSCMFRAHILSSHKSKVKCVHAISLSVMFSSRRWKWFLKNLQVHGASTKWLTDSQYNLLCTSSFSVQVTNHWANIAKPPRISSASFISSNHYMLRGKQMKADKVGILVLSPTIKENKHKSSWLYAKLKGFGDGNDTKHFLSFLCLVLVELSNNTMGEHRICLKIFLRSMQSKLRFHANTMQ